MVKWIYGHEAQLNFGLGVGYCCEGMNRNDFKDSKVFWYFMDLLEELLTFMEVLLALFFTKAAKLTEIFT